jgi:hypothetical protein
MSFLVFLESAGAVFAVITCTTPPVVSSVRLSPPNVDGASACARAPALKATESNAVPSAKKIRGLRTSARYAGNHKSWQAFFLIKNPWRMVAYQRTGFGAYRNQAPCADLITVREIIRSKSGRRTKHLIAVDENPVSMTGHEFVFVRCYDCSASGRQTQDQSPIGCDTHDTTAHGTSATLLGVCGRTPAGTCAFGFRGNRFLGAPRTRLAGGRWRRFGVCLS